MTLERTFLRCETISQFTARKLPCERTWEVIDFFWRTFVYSTLMVFAELWSDFQLSSRVRNKNTKSHGKVIEPAGLLGFSRLNQKSWNEIPDGKLCRSPRQRLSLPTRARYRRNLEFDGIKLSLSASERKIMLNIYQGIIINVAHYLCEMLLLFKLCAQSSLPFSLSPSHSRRDFLLSFICREESNFRANKLKKFN